MNIYLSTTTEFNNNGLGFLTDVLSANVIEELNGQYQLSFSYPSNGKLSEYIVEENIVKCKVADGTYQLFRINQVKKDFNTIQVVAFHIFYDLLNNFLEDTYPQNLNGQLFLKHILDHTVCENQFNAISDISSIASARYVRKNPVEVIMGNADNTVLSLFNGELKRDNFDIKILSRVGQNNGVKLFIGKNITGVDVSVDITSMATRIMPQGYDGLLLPEKYVDSPLINSYPTPKIKKIEFSDVKYDVEDESAYHTLEEAYTELRRLANEQYSLGADKPSINIKIDWIELSKTNEYKNYSNLEKVNLGDTITSYLFNMNFETRVIKITYNPLTDVIEKYEIGTPKVSIGTSMNNIKREVESIDTASILNEAKEDATNLITTAMGGYIYKTQSELYIMDTNDPTTAQNVWRWNINGLGYSSTGVNGPYGIAMTMDGKIVADFITTGTLNTNVIQGYDSLIIQVENNTKNFNNYYSKNTVNTMLMDVESGVTNTFSEAGGNNILRNTGLWFESNDTDNPYEFWLGNVKKGKNDNAVGYNSMLLQNGTLEQEQEVPNGDYSISFYYQKLNQLCNASVVINDVEYPLESVEVKQFYTGEKDNETGEYIVQPIVVSSNHINIKFKCDADNGVEVYDLMCNKGSVKLAYSQNQNETTTDTVNISKGITITSSNDENVKFKADYDGIRILDGANNPKTKFTDKGMETDEAIIRYKEQTCGTLIQEVGEQTWFTRM